MKNVHPAVVREGGGWRVYNDPAVPEEHPGIDVYVELDTGDADETLVRVTQGGPLGQPPDLILMPITQARALAFTLLGVVDDSN